MIEIPLKNGGIAKIDEIDKHLAFYNWRKSNSGHPCRTIYFGHHSLNRVMFLHHAIMGFPLYKKEIDHIDGDPCNNSRSNLRIVTHRENQWNRKEHRGEVLNKSPYIGVHPQSSTKNPWYAMIMEKGKQYRLGSFKTPEQAKEVYEAKLKKLAVK